jgi:hypothetical protein
VSARPLAIDLFCGLGGWADGLIATGWHVIGFDIERHAYGKHRYPGSLVIQDVLTLSGAQFKDAGLIVCSPPCQEFSYMAMPWSRAKAKAAAIRADESGKMLAELTRLFDACFRIQAEASLAAGRHIPMIVENVRGAQPWVGLARWSFGSYYLWGDVPALMPVTVNRLKGGQTNWRDHGKPGYRGVQLQDHFKSSGLNWSDPTKRGQDFTRVAGRQAAEGVKARDADGYERTHPNAFGWKAPRTSSDNVSARKAASALIAKIPFALAAHIGATFRH